MRRLTLLAAVILTAGILAAGPAGAAGFNWAGYYVGGLVGGAWGSFDPKTSTPGEPLLEFAPSSLTAFNNAGTQAIKPSGFIGGADAGYNWVFGNYLAGIEGDIESFQLHGNASSGPLVQPCCAPSSFILSSSASTTWLATLRGRIGWIAGNNWLFYGTGGFAFTKLHGNFSFSENFYGAPPENASISGEKTGYTVGGGIEAPVWPNWTLKAEYLYVRFGTVAGSGSYGPPVLVSPLPFYHSIDLHANIARAGLNYHF